jgi:enolase
MRIRRIQAREILDSRGIPTISTFIELDNGTSAKGEVPSGASTGTNEVLELRDGDKKRYMGKGVLKAVDIINSEISQAVKNRDFRTQKELDEFLITLDGTEQKNRLGGNTILSVSMAFCKATARSLGVPLYEYFAKIYWEDKFTLDTLQLPTPLILVMEGGVHGGWATDIQEFMIVPDKKRFSRFAERLRAGAEVFHSIHDILGDKKYDRTVGFEGAFAPSELRSNTEAFEIILKGIEKAGYKLGEDFTLAIDVASSEFFNKKTKKYQLVSEKKSFAREKWLEKQKGWYEKYPMFSIEDPFDQEDWDGWQIFMKELGDKYQVVGDDLLTTNINRIQKAIDLKAVNSVLIKLNQIGTVTETLDAIKSATNAGYSTIISHRAGETNDDMIADLVVGTPATQSKFGAPDRGERLAKYNRLLEIEASL